MDVAVERQQLLDLLVKLDGGDEGVRAVYASFTLEGLRRAAASAEIASRDISRLGRLGANWQDGGPDIITTSDLLVRDKSDA